jgi:SAM-dependent methyltransferase
MIEDAGVYDGYDVVSCDLCGMMFANNIPSQIRIDDYYHHFSKYEVCNTTPIQSEYRSFCIECITELVDINHSIIDIGCGYGDILRKLRNRGFNNLIAVDTSAGNIASLATNGINGINNSLFNLETLGVKEHDLIILMAVLEHIVDLSGALDIISKITKENGFVFVTVPDLLKFQTSADFPFREFSVEHINYFDISSLVHLFLRYGMVLEKQWSFPDTIIAAFRKTPHVKPYIADYIKKSEEQLANCVAKVSRFLTNQTPLLVFGVGMLTQYLLANTTFSSLNIVGFVDSNSNYHGKQLFGKDIMSPDCLRKETYIGMPIIISSYVHNEQIMAYIEKELHIENELVPLL